MRVFVRIVGLVTLAAFLGLRIWIGVLGLAAFIGVGWAIALALGLLLSGFLLPLSCTARWPCGIGRSCWRSFWPRRA